MEGVSDPDTNIVFSLHVYGLQGYTASTLTAGLAKLAALSKSAGMLFVVGEFGPDKDIGPSPTMLTPGQVITAAESNGIGWLAWAWDDNNLSGGKSDDTWFGMTYAGPGIYNTSKDLTAFGKDVVLNSTYGITKLTTKASIF
jgi:hypothetical protein